MSDWAIHHRKGEELASAAQEARRTGETQRSAELYRQAADAEIQALDALEPDKSRTRGITAVSAVSLLYKGAEFQKAQSVACRWLAADTLPDFAVTQLRELLQTIWTEQAALAAGVRFTKDNVIVSVRGGEIVTGGAPLDLILRKVEGVQAIFFRTIEMLLNKPFRKRGGPSQETQELFRPWLFQAPAGSYQFAVRVQEPKQLPLFPGAAPTVEKVTNTFLEIVRRSATDPEASLPEVVPDPDYRATFLKLTRNLAPTGKTFSELEIRSERESGIGPVLFAPSSRKAINDCIKKHKASASPALEQGEVQLKGVLRALHLDKDWLEVTVFEPTEQHIKIEEAGDAIDDVVGPMVNRRVTVEAVKTVTGTYLFRDIQTVE
jgi:hypothetical protein